MTEIITIPCDQLVAHPDNDPSRSDIDNCQDLIEIIAEYGQREPGKVRRVAADRYMLLSGHRRATCCRYLGIEFRALLVDDDASTDDEATRDLVLCNVRRDLDPIAKATLMRRSIDGGIAIDETARLFGTTVANVRQTMRMLDLPPSLQSLVADGTLPLREARHFIPFADATLATDRLVDEIRKNEHMQRGWKPHNVADAYRRHTRPCDRKTRHTINIASGKQSRKFKITPDIDQRLQIVTLPVGPGKAAIPVAQNIVLWDRLQRKALASRSEASRSEASRSDASQSDASGGGGRAVGGQSAGDGTDQPSEADVRQAEIESDRDLAIWIDRWWMHLIRACLSHEVANNETPMGINGGKLPSEAASVLIAHLGKDASKWIELCFATLDDMPDGTAIDASTADIPAAWRDIRFVTAYGIDYLDRLFAILAYPSEYTILDQHRVVITGIPSDKALPLSAPQWDGMWTELANWFGLDPQSCWENTTDETHIAGQLLKTLFRRHDRRQLESLARTLGLSKTAGITVDDLLSVHTDTEPLPMIPRGK
ncbi:ParB/RepB/Spo0J family partition protein [Roseiconus lacunae]|uniref:ParB N-terminal domain-containing protein n=1 Tax=Roseiconus lacunae TaxID=2605694 RepID=A0ABT7PH37_9BACT|nr:ParB N-terminal domain-containing protein [Roseiconus lacunae]MDM4015815.1 ParB N-terminal domain-containing protein [Roseiconus lacunae]